MPKVKLARRWGPYQAGRTVDVDDEQARWLVRSNYAESTGDLKAPEQEAVAPGSNGPDPLAGADASRLRMQAIHSTRDKTEGQLTAAEGAPPAYRAGYTSDARKREGEAGRNFREGSDDRAGTLSAPADSPADDGPRATSKAAQSPDQNEDGGGTRNTAKPARRRSTRSSS